MNVKVADRYVSILTDVIDNKIRNEGENITFDKSYISDIIENIEGSVSEKTYKQTVRWFYERSVFEKVGNTFGMKYKIHPNFKYKLSKSRDTVIKQCRFIIGQLVLFSNMFWDETESLYSEVITSDGFFEFLPTIKPKKVSDTVSKLILNKHNEEYEGIYNYELLKTLQLLKTPFDIKIKNKTLNMSMKDVTLNKITFNFDTVTVEFNNSKFEIESLENIKNIKIQTPKDIMDRIDYSIDYLNGDSNVLKKLVELLETYKVGNEIFHQTID